MKLVGFIFELHGQDPMRDTWRKMFKKDSEFQEKFFNDLLVKFIPTVKDGKIEFDESIFLGVITDFNVFLTRKGYEASLKNLEAGGYELTFAKADGK